MEVVFGFFLLFFAGWIVVYVCELVFDVVVNLGDYLGR